MFGSPFPHARRQLIINETAQHFIVYDERSNHIHQLNSTSAAVWRHCDGQQSAEDLQRLVSLDLGESVPIGSITLALAQLSDANLLETPWVAAGPPQRQSRRSLLRKTMITGAIAAPTLISISAPHAAAALSCASGEVDCLGDGRCCTSDKCNALLGCCDVPLCGESRLCCTSGICTQTSCCEEGGSICGGRCCPAGQCASGAQCCEPGLAPCGFDCCGAGQVCNFGKCCAADKACGFGSCCLPNQTCVGGTSFGTCQ